MGIALRRGLTQALFNYLYRKLLKPSINITTVYKIGFIKELAVVYRNTYLRYYQILPHITTFTKYYHI